MTFAALSAFAEEFLALRRSSARHDPRQQGVELRYLKHREKLLRGFLLCWRNCGCPWPIPSSLLLDWIAVGADRQHPYRDQHRYYTVRTFLRQVRIIEPATGITDARPEIGGVPFRCGQRQVNVDQLVIEVLTRGVE